MMKKAYDFAFIAIFFILCVYTCIHAPLFAPFVRQALDMCAQVLIPSLFPFLFLTQIFSRTGLAEAAGKTVSFILSPLFGVPKELCGAFLAGLAGGYPNGATAAGIAYEKGRCSKQAAERVAALSDNASPAFLIGVAGAYSLGSPKAGFLLCAALLLTLVSNAAFLRLCYPLKKSVDPIKTSDKRVSFAAAFCQSVQNAVTNMLLICSYVILFYMLSGVICHVFLQNSNALARFGVQSFFEISGAVMAVRNADFPLNHILCAAAVGFSGLSVICQVTDISAKYGFSVRQFLFTRLTGTVLMPLYTALLLLVLPRQTISVCGYVRPLTVTSTKALVGTVLLYAFFTLFAMCVLGLIYLISEIWDRKHVKNLKT